MVEGNMQEKKTYWALFDSSCQDKDQLTSGSPVLVKAR